MYNEESAEFVLDFIQCLKHTDGKWAGKPFIPMEWQAKAVREFYGTLKELSLIHIWNRASGSGCSTSAHMTW